MTLHRRDVVKELLRQRGDLLVIADKTPRSGP